MTVRRRIVAGLAAFAALALMATGCTNKSPSDTSSAGPGGQTSNLKFAVITHGSAGDAFWDVVKKGSEAAGKDLGVAVNYQSSGDPAQQSTMINDAVSQKVNGIVVSMANPDALKDSIQKAVSAGIPVITINSGAAKSASFGALAHVGQDESVAGQGAGKKLAGSGGKHLLCVVHEAGNVGLEQRCAGAKSSLGGTVDNLQVDIANVAGAQNTIAGKLQADKSIDGVLTLNPAVAMAAVAGVKSANSSAKIATFDLNADVGGAVGAGDVLFAGGPRQDLQGDLPIGVV